MGLKHLWDGVPIKRIDDDIDNQLDILIRLVAQERAAASRAWKNGDKVQWRHHHAMARAYQRGVDALGFIGCPF